MTSLKFEIRHSEMSMQTSNWCAGNWPLHRAYFGGRVLRLGHMTKAASNHVLPGTLLVASLLYSIYITTNRNFRGSLCNQGPKAFCHSDSLNEIHQGATATETLHTPLGNTR